MHKTIVRRVFRDLRVTFVIEGHPEIAFSFTISAVPPIYPATRSAHATTRVRVAGDYDSRNGTVENAIGNRRRFRAFLARIYLPISRQSDSAFAIRFAGANHSSVNPDHTRYRTTLTFAELGPRVYFFIPKSRFSFLTTFSGTFGAPCLTRDDVFMRVSVVV